MNQALESWNKRIGIEIADLTPLVEKDTLELTEHAHPILGLEEVDTLPDHNIVVGNLEDSFDEWLNQSLEETSIIINPMKEEASRPAEQKVVSRAERAKANEEAMQRWLEQQRRKGSMSRALIVSTILIIIAMVLVTIMVGTASAGMAFMRFEVVAVTEEIITVKDEYGDTFTFYKEGSPEVNIGQEVIVATDFTYVGSNKWEWNRKRTSIIDVKTD